MSHYSKPPIKLKLINSFHKHILDIYLFLFLYIPLLCNSTSNNDIPSNIDTLTYLIDPLNGNIGQRCHDMGIDCNFFPDWEDKNSMDRHELDCPLNNICILRCPTSDSCHDIDINLNINSTLIMDCIATDSCKNVKIFGDNALLIYIEANNINSMTNSEIYCPLYNGNNYTKTCIIEGSCIDINGGVHCDTYDKVTPTRPSPTTIEGHINDIAMISHVSIYSSKGYLELDIECDFEDEKMCNKLIKHSILLCDGNSGYNAQDICWIDYDMEHDMFICDGDDIYRDDVPLKCRNHYYSNENNKSDSNDNNNSNNNSNNSTIDMEGAEVSNDIINNTNNSNDNNGALTAKDKNGINDLFKNVLYHEELLVLIIIISISICCFCFLFIIFVCCKCCKQDKENENIKREFKFVQKQTQKHNNEYKKHNKNKYKLCQKCTAKSCLCYYLSCCCCCYCCHCLWNNNSSNNISTNMNRNNRNKSQNINQTKNINRNSNSNNDTQNMQQIEEIENTIDTDEPQTINPLSIDEKGGIFPSFFIKNKIIKNKPISNNNKGVELVVMSNSNNNNKLQPPMQLSHIHSIDKQTSLSSQLSYDGHHTQPHTHIKRNTFSATNTNTSGEKYIINKRQSHSRNSNTSHCDGLEEQAAKKIGDAKLGIGTNTLVTPQSNNNNNTITPFNITPKTPNDTNSNSLNDLITNNHTVFGVVKGKTPNDNDYQFALQLQQQQLFEAVANTTTTTNGNTNGNTDGNTPNISATTDGATTTIIEILPVLDMGDGFKIGPMNEESTTIQTTHSSSISQSISTSQFDPEHPNHIINAQNEFEYD